VSFTTLLDFRWHHTLFDARAEKARRAERGALVDRPNRVVRSERSTHSRAEEFVQWLAQIRQRRSAIAAQLAKLENEERTLAGRKPRSRHARTLRAP